MTDGEVVINAGGMYLEMARALAQADVELSVSQTGITDPNDLPNITKVNIHFAYGATAIIMAVASLEAKVNGTARGIFEGQYDKLPESGWSDEQDRQRAAAALDDFKATYADDDERIEFYKYTKLSKKVNLLYDAFSQTRPCDSSKDGIRQLWEEMIELEQVRNDLVHAKGESLEDKDAMGLLSTEPHEIKRFVNVVARIEVLMQQNLPMIMINANENAVIEGAVLKYADKPMDEHILLTNTIYTPENRQRFGTR